MEKINFKKIGLIFILSIFILPAVQALAQDKYDYTVLAPLPGVADEAGGTTNLKDYIPAMFNLAIGLSAIAAVLNIVFGGLMYMSTDAVMKKEDGKKRIQNSVYGLVLVIGAWLILYTVSPNLLKFSLDIEAIQTKAPAGLGGSLSTPGVPMKPEEIAASDALRKSLEGSGVYAYASPCTRGETRGCVNLNGLSETAQSGLRALSSGAGCSGSSGGKVCVMITGGTEKGHSETGGHPTGDSLDLRFDLNIAEYVEKHQKGSPVRTSLGNQYTVVVNGRDTTFLREGDHWHVTFK